MKKVIIILCAVAAFAGCSRQGGTGTGSTERGGAGSRYATNGGGGTSPTNSHTNRFGTDQGGADTGTSPQGTGTQ